MVARLPRRSGFIALLAMPLIATGCSGGEDRSSPTSGGMPPVHAGVVHSAYLDGRYHAPGYCRPLENCTACHGSFKQ